MIQIQVEKRWCTVDMLQSKVWSVQRPLSERNMLLSDEGPTLETLDFTFYIGSTTTFLYFDLYLNTAYAANYVYFIIWM